MTSPFMSNGTCHMKNSSVDTDRQSHVLATVGSSKIDISICLKVKENSRRSISIPKAVTAQQTGYEPGWSP